jgi:hypothetical protein
LLNKKINNNNNNNNNNSEDDLGSDMDKENLQNCRDGFTGEVQGCVHHP